MAAPTKPAGVKKVLANSEPSTHGTSATSQCDLATSAYEVKAVVGRTIVRGPILTRNRHRPLEISQRGTAGCDMVASVA
jgi:hypothetical protein